MKTVNLQLSKQLKEAGFLQDTSHHWGNRFDKWWLFDKESLESLIKKQNVHWSYASPTADEILENLPQTTIEYGKGWFGVFSKGHDDGDEKSLADALAKLWLYLDNNNLLREV